MCLFQFHKNFYAPVNFDKAIWLLKISASFEKLSSFSSVGPEILAFRSNCSAKF